MVAQMPADDRSNLAERVLHSGQMHYDALIVDLLRGIVMQLAANQALIQGVGHADPPAVAAPLPPVPAERPLAPFTINAPLSVGALADLVSAARIPGLAYKRFPKIDLLVPPGQTVTITMPVPARNIITLIPKTTLNISATYHNNLITLKVALDGAEITDPSNPFTLTADAQLSLGEAFYFENQITFTVANASSSSATVSFWLDVQQVLADFFRNFYQPLLQLNYRELARWAEAANGGRQLP